MFPGRVCGCFPVSAVASIVFFVSAARPQQDENHEMNSFSIDRSL